MKRIIISLFLFTAFISPKLSAQDTAICYLRDEGGRSQDHNVDFIKMVLNLKFNTKEGIVLGNVKYDFRPIQYVVDTLFLNAPDINIKKVLLDGKETPFTMNSEGVVIRFLQAMNWNKNYKLDITYEATPRRGLYFVGWNVDAKNTDNDRYFTRKQIWTQGQLTDNRYWIPCYDHVNDKMITETITTFDSTYTVISNGTLKSKTKNTDGTFTWHYAMNKPMVPYLIMLAIDKYKFKDYKSKNGMVSRQYYYDNLPQTVEPTYQYSAEMMDWLPAELETPYPWLTYCNVPVQDFMYGAMENTTATVFGDFSLNDARMVLDRSYLGTNTHELTHQWFGDYITEYGSQDHWLHESFATYYAKAFTRTIQGEDSYQWGKRGEANASIAADNKDRYPVAHSQGGSSRHYPKGSFVIDMIRYVVGDSVFKRSVGNYLKKHAYANVSNHDFMLTFLNSAGINLDWFFDQWIYRAGYPNYVVTYERQKDRVAFFVKQTHKVDELTGYFKMPVVFEVYFKDGSSSTKKAWIGRASDTVYVSAPNESAVDYALFDPGSHVLKTIEFKKSFEELSAQALNAKNFIDRYDAIVALKETNLDTKRDLLMKVFAKETFHPIRNEIIAQLSRDNSMAAQSLFKRALHDKDHLVRRAVVDNLETFPDAIGSDVEALLTDSSYVTIENTLRKLAKLYPAKTQEYLAKTKGVMGHNNNVRILWLEISANSAATADEKEASKKKLVEYCSNRYEFRTRGRAMEAIERLGYCDDALIMNLFNAALYTNTRLSGPATKTLKTLFQKRENLEMAKLDFQSATWKDWEKKIIGDLLKQ